MNLLNIILYAILIYCFFRLFTATRRTSKGRDLVKIVSNINNKEEFEQQINEMINTCGNEVYQNKARVIKLWGESYHHDYSDFEDCAEALDVNALISTGRTGKDSITETEDSFFYLYLGIPNLLYGNNAGKQVRILQEKVAPFEERLSSQLVQALGIAYRDFSENKNDRGIPFFEKLLEGDYGEYTYSKNLIGLYKMIANAELAKNYEMEGTLDEHEEVQPLLKSFADTGLGQRWLKAIDLEVKTDEEETPAEDIEDEKNELSEEEAQAPAEETAEEQPVAEIAEETSTNTADTEEENKE